MIPKESKPIVVNAITRAAFVEMATPLAGYSKGVYSFDGHRILVTSSPNIIKPQAGSCRTIERLISGMFGPEQSLYLYAWLKVAYEALASGTFVPGQLLVLAGPKDTGKSMFQSLILTAILGGRAARPYRYMTMQTTFNADLFKAEHLYMGDEKPALHIEERQAFGNAIKDLIVNSIQSFHPKGVDAKVIPLPPFWRMSLSLNDEPQNLMVLPPLEDSILDKMMLFKVAMPDCLPQDIGEERAKFSETIKQELPCLIYDLIHFSIPQHMRGGRMGVKAYFNPDLVASVEDLSRETQLMTLVEEGLFHNGNYKNVECWEGTATELSSKLKEVGSSVASEMKSTFTNSAWTGRTLTNIEKSRSHNGSVTSRMLHGRRLFTVLNPRFHENDDE